MPDEKSLIERITSIESSIKSMQENPLVGYHTHTGFDMNKVFFSDIYQKKLYVPYTIPGTNAATGANYSTFFIAPVPCYISSFREVHATAGTDGGAVTLQLEKLTSTTAPGSGTSVLSSALSLKATANTVQSGSLTTTLASINLAVGNRLALKSSGTLTAVANVSVLVELTF